MEMEKIIGLIRTQKLNAKVMIGGAAVTPEVARKFKADGFAPSAFAAVTAAKKLLAGER